MNNVMMLWKALLLPHWWQELVLFSVEFSIRKMKHEQNRDIKPLCRSVAIAICKCDRRYIDIAIQAVDLDSLTKRARCDAFNVLGTALYDLGFRDEGLIYMEKALAISYGSSTIHSQLCSRMNDEALSRERLQCCISYRKLYPEKAVISETLLAKAYISCKQFKLASSAIEKLVRVDKRNNFLWAEYYYAQGDYDAAAKCFFEFPYFGTYHFWHAQYDYKEAVTYFKTNQYDKWQGMAVRIGKRLAWNKLYRIDFLESEGIERIAEIDQLIEMARAKKRLFYSDKLFLQFIRTPWVIFEAFFIYRFVIMFWTVIVISVLLFICTMLR